MAPNPIRITTLLAALVLVAFIEWSAPHLFQITRWPPLTVLGLIRIVEITAMLGIILCFEPGLAAIGWAPKRWLKGIGIGALWSLGAGFTAAAGMTALYVSGRHPLVMLRTPLPGTALATFFLVGGIIGPLAEEICFRGLLYTFFRRWGAAAALVASTLSFVALHPVHGLVQIIGGLIFALAFEATANLMVPITIHILANFAIFLVSLPQLAG